MKEAIRCGLVGAGAIAQAYAQGVNGVSGLEIVSVADPRASTTEAMAERVGGRGFPDHGAMLDAEAIDAVIVCTPPATHDEICLDAIGRGKHVLCEKPLSLSAAGASKVIAAAERAGVTLTMSSKFRYVEDIVQAKSMVASGMLGDIVSLDNAFTAWVDMSERWNSDPEIGGGGVLIDNGTHSVDIIRYLLGPITEVYAVEGPRVQPLRVEDTVRMFTRNADGALGSVDLSWSLRKDLETFVDIYGTRGTIRIGWKQSQYRQTGNPDWVSFGSGYDKLAAFRKLLADFGNAVGDGTPARITPSAALASVEVVEAAYQAMRSGRWTSVAHADRGDGEA